jgi:hypothetical protein
VIPVAPIWLPSLPRRRGRGSANLAEPLVTCGFFGGATETRTPDLLHAIHTPAAAERGLAWLCAEFTCGFRGPPWLPTWLPELVSAANLRSSGYPATPGQPPAAEPG